MAALPLAKLGSLLVKTLAKPVANVLKSEAKVSATSRLSPHACSTRG